MNSLMICVGRIVTKDKIEDSTSNFFAKFSMTPGDSAPFQTPKSETLWFDQYTTVFNKINPQKQNLMVELYKESMTEGEKKIGISLIPLNTCEVEKSTCVKYDLLAADNQEKMGSLQLTLLLKEFRRLSIITKVNDSDEKILKETTKKAKLNTQTMLSLTPFMFQEKKEDVNERMKPGPSEYQIEIDQLSTEELHFFGRKRLQKLKKKEEKRKKLEPFLKKFMNLPEEEALRLNKIACTLRNITMSDSKVGVAYLFTNNIVFKVPNEKFSMVADLCKVEKIEISNNQFSFTTKGLDYKLSERSPVKVLIPLLKTRFSNKNVSSSQIPKLTIKEKEELEDSEDDEDEVDDEAIFTVEDKGQGENFLMAEEFEKIYTDVEIKCSPVKFFKIFFSDDAKEWEQSLNELKGNTKVEISSWLSSNKTSFKREINYIAPVSGGPPFCPKETQTLEKQKYVLNKDNFTHEKLITMTDIPYSKNFGIEQRTILKSNGENSSLLTIEVGIRWFNKPSFIVSGQIKSTSIKKMVVSSKSWLDKVQSDLESGTKNDSDGISERRKSVKIGEVKEITSTKKVESSPVIPSKSTTNSSSSSSTASLATSKDLSSSASGSFVQSNLFLASYALLYLLVIYIALRV